MTKPILDVVLRSMGRSESKVRAVFDTGSHYSIVREASLPPKTSVLKYPKAETLKAAAVGGKLKILGATVLIVQVGGKRVRDEVLVSPDLSQEMIVGAGTMQKWDISIHNNGGRTRVTVGRDIDDPDVIEVD